MSNPVEELKNQIVALAGYKKLGVKFAQSNQSRHDVISRVYLFPYDNVPGNCRGPQIIKMWEFDCPQNHGVSTRCKRYSIYSQVLKFLNDYIEGTENE